MAATSTTDINYVLKELYLNNKVPNMEYQKHRFLNDVKHTTNFRGKNRPVPLQYTSSQGASALFATAQANIVAPGYNQFTVTRLKEYSLVRITNEAIKASDGDDGSFIDGLKAEIDSAFRTCTRSLALSLYRDGTGSRGTINSTVTGTTLTLQTKRDIVNFEVGMKIQFANPTGPALRDSGEEVTITAINRSAGSMTVSPSLSTIAGLTTADLIVRSGDLGVMLSGLMAWLPISVTATSFYGMTRTTDATRLGGYRYDASGGSIEEGLIQACSDLCAEGGMPDKCYLNPGQFANLQKELGSRVIYSDHKSGDVGFKAIQLVCASGVISVIPDQDAPSNYGFLLQSDTWELTTLGDAPMLIDTDGNQMLRVADDDSVEVRVGYYGNLLCNAPGWNCLVTLPTLAT